MKNNNVTTDIIKTTSEKTVLVLFIIVMCFFNGCSKPYPKGESIDRGLVALSKENDEVYIGWRLFSSDPEDIGFNIYRMNYNSKEYVKVNQTPIVNSTNYIDKVIKHAPYMYKVKAVINGKEIESNNSVYVFAMRKDKPYISIMLEGNYRPYSVGIADLDSDGKYDYVIKQPHTSIDPGLKGWRASKEP